MQNYLKGPVMKLRPILIVVAQISIAAYLLDLVARQLREWWQQYKDSRTER